MVRWKVYTTQKALFPETASLGGGGLSSAARLSGCFSLDVVSLARAAVGLFRLQFRAEVKVKVKVSGTTLNLHRSISIRAAGPEPRAQPVGTFSF